MRDGGAAGVVGTALAALQGHFAQHEQQREDSGGAAGGAEQQASAMAADCARLFCALSTSALQQVSRVLDAWGS